MKIMTSIDLARQLIEQGISEEARAALEKEFPELKESDDERIRKRLIDCLKLSLKGAEEQDAAGCSRYKDIEAYKWALAYLEKQKEQKPAEWSERDEKMMRYVIGSLDTNISDSNFKNIRIWFESIKDRVQPQPKQELSREDEKKIERLAFLVSVAEEKEMISPSESIDLRNFIKSLRPQPNQEWSEEDEGIMDNLVQHLKVAYSQCDWLDKTINWLKSLRPQPHWKPSKEQMAVLKNAIHFYGKTIGKDILESLYNDLKKL